MNKLITNIILFLIWLYQKTLSQFLPPTCRFSPSCSNYMLQAINQHGVGKGVILGVKLMSNKEGRLKLTLGVF